MRINSAKDDAAGYAVAEAVKATKNVTDQSIQNTQDAISLVQTAEGALDVVSKILQRALTLTTQKENDSLTPDQETSIDAEIDSLMDEIGQIQSRTKFQGGGDSIFDLGTLTFSTGDETPTEITIEELSLNRLAGGADGATLDSASGVDDFMAAVQQNITDRAALGTWQTRLNFVVDNMQTLSNNLADAQSRIIDTDYAAETAQLTRGQILQQAATSMLAQANQMPNVILTLLK
jgi:flagellin